MQCSWLLFLGFVGADPLAILSSFETVRMGMGLEDGDTGVEPSSSSMEDGELRKPHL